MGRAELERRAVATGGLAGPNSVSPVEIVVGDGGSEREDWGRQRVAPGVMAVLSQANTCQTNVQQR